MTREERIEARNDRIMELTDQLYSVKAIAEMMGISKATVSKVRAESKTLFIEFAKGMANGRKTS